MTFIQDLTGQVSGTLVALKYKGKSKWLCKCKKCGNEVVITTAWFHKNQQLKRDGCKHVKKICIGDTFGYLTVIGNAKDYVKPKSKAHERVWKCQCICGRTKNVLESNLKSLKSTSCGLCKNQVSIPEKMIYYYLSLHFSEIIENYRPDFLNGKEIDIYLPTIHVGIEYDGERWHKDLSKDLEKDNVLSDNGILLIRIREPKCPPLYSSSKCIITPKPTTNGTHMTVPIRKLFKFLSNEYGLKGNFDIDCLRDNADICKSIINTIEHRSLQYLFPEIAKEWDYKKNYPLTPDKVAAHAGKKAWWICEKGHSFSSVIASRTGIDSCGCPLCSGKGSSLYVDGKYIGENSLLKSHPDIAIEFDYRKNGITADEIAVSSNKKMWWKCKTCGYEWQTKVNNRTSSLHTGCPRCAKTENKGAINRINNLIKKNGSLLDNYPELCNEWDYEKNQTIGLYPDQITSGSSKKAWWKCQKNHSYLATINKRTGNKPTGCPYCKNKPIMNVETGEIFVSSVLAAKSCGLKSYSKITECCKDQNKTAKGYHWTYIE